MQFVGATIDGVPAGDKYMMNPVVTKPFIERFGVTFPMGALDPNSINEFGQFSPMIRTTVPMMFFIDKKGVIQAQYLGADPLFQGDEPTNLRRAIDTLFPAAGAPAKPVKKAAPAPPAAKKAS